MVRLRPALLLLLAVTLPMREAQASKPSSSQIERCREESRRRAEAQERAAPWRQALHACSALAVDTPLVEQLFLTTYKHYDPSRHQGPALRAWADNIASAWHLADSLCTEVAVEPSVLARAVCRMTNSDMGPVSCSSGLGMDSVRDGASLLSWVRPLIDVARRARAAGLSPQQVWHDIHRAHRYRNPGELDGIDVTAVPLGPKW